MCSQNTKLNTSSFLFLHVVISSVKSRNKIPLISLSTCVGYVTTIFGRQRLLPGINSNDAQLRAQSERQAVNFVIQGTSLLIQEPHRYINS